MFTPGSLKRRLPLAIALAAACVTALSCEMPLELEPTPSGSAANCFDYGQQLRIEGTASMSIPVHDLAVIGDCAYGANGRLLVIETSPTGGRPEIKETTLWAHQVASAGDFLCTASSSSFSVVEVIPERRGQVIGKITLPFFIQDLASDGQYAYLLSSSFGLWIADIGDPAAPRIVGSADVPGSDALAIRGNIACVIGYNNLWTIDITNRTSPQLVGHLTSQLRMDAVAMVNHFAVISTGGTITVVDIGDPSAPEVLLTSDLAEMHVRDLAFDGSRAYLCGDDLVVVDLTRPTSPVIIGRLTGVNANTVAADGDRIYLAGSNGFIVAKVPSTRRPSPFMVVNTQGVAYRTALRPPIACVAGGYWGLWVIDTQGSPGVVGRLEFRGAAYDVVCDSSYVYVAAGGNGLVIVDASVALGARLVSELQLPAESLAIVVEDHLAYLAQGEFGLWIADVSDPHAPRVVGSLDTAGAQDLVVRDGRAWIADHDFGLVAVDVTDPQRPRIVTGLETPEATALALHGNLAYVVGNTGLLQVIDISNPAAPRIVGSLEVTAEMRDVAIDGHIAYLASHMGLMVADVSNPQSPELIGMAYEGATYGVMIDESSDRVVVSNRNLTVIRRQCDDSGRSVWP